MHSMLGVFVFLKGLWFVVCVFQNLKLDLFSHTHAARYQVLLGASTGMAVAYYHRAITLDPTNGKQMGSSLFLSDPLRVYVDISCLHQVIHIANL